MEKPKVLSGEEIVSIGVTKHDSSLPEIGSKDVAPNGSWLEQKQIQAALEAHKNLVEVERILKSGSLSHAVWRDDLKLAEVTHKTGGYWQFLGHNVGKTMYLRPEEALYLIEVNCLQLKHNDVTVSLQKAYSLLLQSSKALFQYRVYASLSRIGYRVFRHKGPKANNERSSCQKVNTENNSKKNDTKLENSPLNVDIKLNTTETENIDSLRDDTVKDCDVISNILEKPENVDTGGTVDEQTTDVDLCLIKIDSGIGLQGTVNNENNEIELQKNGANLNVSESNMDSSQIKKLIDNDNVINGNKSPILMEFEEVQSKSVDDSSQSETIHEIPTVTETITCVDNNNEDNNMVEANMKFEDKTENLEINTYNQEAVDSGILMEEEQDGKENADLTINSGTQNMEDDTQCKEITKNDDSNTNNSTASMNSIQNFDKCNNYTFEYNYLGKLEKLTNREVKPSDSRKISKHFENIPDLYKKQVVAVNVPEEQFIPKNIFVNKSNYMLNLKNIKKRNNSASTESTVYTSSDEVNGMNIRRIRSSSGTEFPHHANIFTNTRFPRHLFYRPFGYWRPQNNLSYYQFNMIFQRPAFNNMYFQSRDQYLPRPNPFLRSYPYLNNLNPNNPNISNNARKRIRTGRTAEFQCIKNLAAKLRQMITTGTTRVHGYECLSALLHSYNIKYKSRLRLSEHFDIVNEEIIETIELDDDEGSKSKRSKLEDDSDKFDENLFKLRELASRLKDLESKDKATASHRRAFSKAIKTFNKSYNADVYLSDGTYEVINRRHITLESSSESDCVVEEKPKVMKSKRLRNPFNVLKRRLERLESQNKPGTSKDSVSEPNTIKPKITKRDNTYNEIITKTFSKAWLPNEEDFGRVEIVPKKLMNVRLLDTNKEQYLYDFMKDQFQQYRSWLEVKIYFLRHLEETNIAFQQEQARILTDLKFSDVGLRPLIDTQDCSDMSSVLQKLRIIKNNKEITSENSLSIDFDVYNRDVQNYKKTSPPRPHFRIICLEESSNFPSASDLMCLHSKYDDNAPLVFAIVSVDSISYIQINPLDLPIYIPKHDTLY